MKKVRFYHWWVYKLFYKMWEPLLKERPDLALFMQEYMKGYLEQEERKH